MSIQKNVKIVPCVVILNVFFYPLTFSFAFAALQIKPQVKTDTLSAPQENTDNNETEVSGQTVVVMVVTRIDHIQRKCETKQK